MYVRREAFESSQIEGTQSTLEDVLAFELDPRRRDVEEIVNYVRWTRPTRRSPSAWARL